MPSRPIPPDLPLARLLALDTSTEVIALAVCHGAQQQLHDGVGGAAASTTLIPTAQALLAQAGLRLNELDALAVARGPGAFTGLRTAISVAQGLALGVGCPVLPIDSLLIVAEDARAQALATGADPDEPWDIWVTMDARMDEIYAGAYRHTPEAGWACTQAPGLFDLPTLAARWAVAPPTAVAGSALAAFGPRLPVGSARCWPVQTARAAALARLATAAWQHGQRCAPEDALPLYLRDKVALTTAEREAAKRMAQAEAGAASPAAASPAAPGAPAPQPAL